MKALFAAVLAAISIQQGPTTLSIRVDRGDSYVLKYRVKNADGTYRTLVGPVKMVLKNEADDADAAALHTINGAIDADGKAAALEITAVHTAEARSYFMRIRDEGDPKGYTGIFVVNRTP